MSACAYGKNKSADLWSIAKTTALAAVVMAVLTSPAWVSILWIELHGGIAAHKAELDANEAYLRSLPLVNCVIYHGTLPRQ